MTKTAFDSALFSGRLVLWPPGKCSHTQPCLAVKKALLVMKFSIVFLFTTIITTHATGVAQTVTLSGSNLKLQQVFTAVEKQTGYVVFSKKNMLAHARPVTVHAANMPLSQLLDTILKNQPLKYVIRDKTIVISPKEVAVPVNKKLEQIAEELPPPPPPLIDVKGRVVDEEGKPVAGASVQVKGNNTKGGSTDVNGYFELKGLDENTVLVVSGVNIETREVKVSGKADLGNVVVKLKVAEGEEVVLVNTGYQNLPKERATGAFERISEKVINRSISTDILSRLEGISSIYFDRRSGGAALSIRGRSTIMANAEPLIVVDNFPYEGNINNINPNDIESVTILRDAAASSIWGVRAANGVIVITTKKGSYNTLPTLNFNANVTYGAKPDLYYAPAMSSADFIEVETFLFDKGFYNATINDIRKPIISPVVEILQRKQDGTLSSAAANEQINLLKANDVRKDFDTYFYRPAFKQQFALNYSGGSNKYNYLLSAGWDKNLSDLERNGLQRLTLQSQNNFKLSEKLRIQLGATYTSIKNENNNPGIQGIFPTSKSLYPYASLVNSDGQYALIPKDYRLSYLNTIQNTGLLDWGYRPLEELQISDRSTRQNDIRLTFGANYKIDPYLSAEIKYQYERQSALSENLYHQNSYTSRNLINLFSSFQGGLFTYHVPLGGILDRSFEEMNSHAGRFQTNYQRNWQKNHELTAIVGSEIRERRSVVNANRIYGYNDDKLTYQNVNLVDFIPTYENLRGSMQIPDGAALSDNILHFVSYYANAAYTFRDKYTVSVSGRKDASNLFGVAANQKGVPLWSSGLSWHLSKEDFYCYEALPHLKFRLTYGISGNVDNSLSALPTIAYYSNAYITGRPYAVLRSPRNSQLRWEKSAIFTMGFDFSLRSRYLYGSFDYYIKKGSDLIGQAPLEPTTGVTSNTGTFSYKGNIANMRGTGFDLELHSSPLKGKLGWQIDFMLNRTTNKITSYQVATSTANSYVGFGNLITPVEGNPVYGIYSYEWAGLDPITGNPQGYLNGEVSQDYVSILFNTLETLTFNGSAVPVWFGSLRNTLSFRNLSLSFNLMYKGGYFFRRSSLNYYNLFSTWQGHEDYSKRWQKRGDELYTTMPSLIYPNSPFRDNFYNNSSALVEKGDHIRFKDINISYSFKTKSNYFKSIQLYTYMNNIAMVWKTNKVGLDPDYYNGGFPVPFSVSVGCKASF